MPTHLKTTTTLTLGPHEFARRLYDRENTPERGSPVNHAQEPASAQTQGDTASPDTFSVAGEEDPGSAVDAPSPPPATTSPHLSNGPVMPLRSDPQAGDASAVQKKPADPANRVSRTPGAPGSRQADGSEEHLQLPHERDENAEMTDGKVRPKIKQAAQDLKNGLVDTDMRATPDLDAKQRERHVPGPGGRPPK